jgi:DNA polymerase I-like protein with 3'-5' exonuclease and polymerase domains
VFDKWVSYARTLGAKVAFSFHDEIGCPVKKGDEKYSSEILLDAINFTNNEVKLNVRLGIDIQYGENYAAVH